MNTGISGLDGLDEKRLSDIRDNASKLSDMKQEVPVDELFPESFIQKHTQFSSINHLLQAAGYEEAQTKNLMNLYKDIRSILSSLNIPLFAAGRISKS